MSPEPLINTARYSTAELLFFAAGGLAWALAYMGVLREIVRNKFVEIPATAVTANIAWEFVWGIVHRTDLGSLFAWGYRVWFFLDLFIVWGLLRYGVRHLGTPKLRDYFRAAVVLAIVAWSATLWLLVRQGYDTPNGIVTGYMVTLLMSALYIPQFFRERDRTPYSPFVAWCKLLGNGLVIGFCVLAYPGNGFLLAICGVTLVLDLYYTWLFHTRRGAVSAPVAAPAA
jgi:hypothetical protein